MAVTSLSDTLTFVLFTIREWGVCVGGWGGLEISNEELLIVAAGVAFTNGAVVLWGQVLAFHHCSQCSVSAGVINSNFNNNS